ncbi:MAG: glycosyltransferase family 9 protein [Asticcacaulis sp.]|uniref:glycosyltransferase family 9 protein n=1 Tax=Asticcacaulis sp. TaxID=1872648 RepID=UPI0039E39C8D
MTGEFPILLLALCEPAKALGLSGVIARLKAEIPHARMTLATTREAAALYQDDDLIDEIQAFDGALFKLKSLHGLSELSRRQWGLCVDIGPTLISRMMKAKTRFTLNPNDSAGVLEQIAVRLKLDPLEIMPTLRVSPRREAQVRSLIDNGRETAPLIAMAPGAGWLGRRWPTERFAVLATRLMREEGPFANHRLLIIGSEAERDTLQALRLATSRAQVMEISGEATGLNAYAALKQAVLFVGNDELWLHLAAAAGIPAFGLFGPSDEAEGPIGNNVLTIRGPRSFADIQTADPKLKLNVCHMLDLTIDHVAAVIEREMAR